MTISFYVRSLQAPETNWLILCVTAGPATSLKRELHNDVRLLDNPNPHTVDHNYKSHIPDTVNHNDIYITCLIVTIVLNSA